MGEITGYIYVEASQMAINADNLTGAALIAAMQASPSRDVEIEPPRVRFPVRDVGLDAAQRCGH
jgi:hypothetical protein